MALARRMAVLCLLLGACADGYRRAPDNGPGDFDDDTAPADPEVMRQLAARCGELGESLVNVVRRGTQMARVHGATVSEMEFARMLNGAVGAPRESCDAAADSIALSLSRE